MRTLGWEEVFQGWGKTLVIRSSNTSRRKPRIGLHLWAEQQRVQHVLSTLHLFVLWEDLRQYMTGCLTSGCIPEPCCVLQLQILRGICTDPQQEESWFPYICSLLWTLAKLPESQEMLVLHRAKLTPPQSQDGLRFTWGPIRYSMHSLTACFVFKLKSVMWPLTPLSRCAPWLSGKGDVSTTLFPHLAPNEMF